LQTLKKKLNFHRYLCLHGVRRETIVRISQLIAGESYNHSFKSKEVFEQETKILRERVYSFMRENWEEMNQEETAKAFPNKLFRDMLSYVFKTQDLNEKAKQGDFEEEVKNKTAKGRKRKDPIEKENEQTEKPKLKKTKK